MNIQITYQSSLWFLFIPRINLSPFTKDFRGEEHYNESIDLFFKSQTWGNFKDVMSKV